MSGKGSSTGASLLVTADRQHFYELLARLFRAKVGHWLVGGITSTGYAWPGTPTSAEQAAPPRLTPDSSEPSR